MVTKRPRHLYVSTACQHEQHYDCRLACTFCDAPCLCPCHTLIGAAATREEE